MVSGNFGRDDTKAEQGVSLTGCPRFLHSDTDYMFDSRAGGRRIQNANRQEHEAG